MTRARLRILVLFASIPPTVVVLALSYQLAMGRLEGRPRGFWAALQWASETMTTTGYGGDTTWSHPATVLLVIATQFIGVVLMYMIVPLFLIRFLEERLELRLPRRPEKRLEKHVVVFRWGPAVESLVRELRRASAPFVVVEPDEATARRVLERGVPVVYGSPGAALPEVFLKSARAIVANGRDEENAAAILVAQQLGFQGEILALVENPLHRRPMHVAGATAVYTPRHILAAALAARASHRIDPRVSGIQSLGDLALIELRVAASSPLAGQTLSQAAVGAKTGAVVIGQWVAGRLDARPGPATRVEPRGILVAVGSSRALEVLGELAGAGAARRTGGFVVGGFGEVGRKVHQLLTDAGETVRVIEPRGGEGVDIVGDVLDPRTLEAARIGEAQAVILALDSDSATLFATVIVRDLAPDVPIIARVNEAENVERIHRAGADFALSISQVSGQMLTHRLLGREAISVDAQLKLVKVSSPRLDGQRASELDLRARTGCSIVGVERAGKPHVQLGADFVFAPGDRLFVCGAAGDVERVLQLYPRD